APRDGAARPAERGRARSSPGRRSVHRGRSGAGRPESWSGPARSGSSCAARSLLSGSVPPVTSPDPPPGLRSDGIPSVPHPPPAVPTGSVLHRTANWSWGTPGPSSWALVASIVSAHSSLDFAFNTVLGSPHRNGHADDRDPGGGDQRHRRRGRDSPPLARRPPLAFGRSST